MEVKRDYVRAAIHISILCGLGVFWAVAVAIGWKVLGVNP